MKKNKNNIEIYYSYDQYLEFDKLCNYILDKLFCIDIEEDDLHNLSHQSICEEIIYDLKDKLSNYKQNVKDIKDKG